MAHRQYVTQPRGSGRPRSVDGLANGTVNWFATLTDSQNLPYGDNAKHTLSRLHYRLREQANASTWLILLDTSGSLLVRSALASAKGVIAGLCYQAYQQRQALELIGFGGDGIATLQAARKPPRDSLPLLDSIGAGGGTPLRAALLHLATRCRQLARQHPTQNRQVFIFTDARSRDVLHGIVLNAEINIIDTEQAVVPLGRARALATLLGGSYRHIDCLETVPVPR